MHRLFLPSLTGANSQPAGRRGGSPQRSPLVWNPWWRHGCSLSIKKHIEGTQPLTLFVECRCTERALGLRLGLLQAFEWRFRRVERIVEYHVQSVLRFFRNQPLAGNERIDVQGKIRGNPEPAPQSLRAIAPILLQAAQFARACMART